MDERMKNRRLSSGLQRVKATLERFRLPLLILMLGGILLLLPSGGTGKALAGLIDHIRTGKVEPGSNVVFWHTGGATALFAEKSMLGDIF